MSGTAFSKADFVVESEYQTPSQEHAFLQPEAGLCFVADDGVITLMLRDNGLMKIRSKSHMLWVCQKRKVRVIYPAIGGAFWRT